jgi:hypothetical protein
MATVESTIIEQIPVLSLEQRRDTLAARLEMGFEKIEQAEREGKDTVRWEQAWLQLLKEYEGVCDQIASRPVKSAG